MLDLNFVRENLPLVEEKLRQRGLDPAAVLKDFRALDTERRQAITEAETRKAQRNRASEDIAKLKKAGQDASAAMAQTKELREQIQTLEKTADDLDARLREILVGIPNLPHASVPVGQTAEDNVEVRRWGTPPKFDFTPKPHWDLGPELGILDLERAVKLTGARFAVYWDLGAKLERALANFMLDLHTREHGYTEVLPPYLVNSDSMYGTGQLPKFAADLFKVPEPVWLIYLWEPSSQTGVAIEASTGETLAFNIGQCDSQLSAKLQPLKQVLSKPLTVARTGSTFHLPHGPFWLIPTAEVPVTNLYRDEVLDQARLPISLTAYTPCFRSEAGSYGKDVRGIIRQHQFQKVELVKFTRPENSYEQHEKLTHDAEEVLEKLGLHYRVVTLCTGDMGAAAAKTYDIEVWLPGQQLFREISSCSNFESYQARRANIRYRPEGKNKSELVHTLNGSGLAVGRTWVAIVENYQQADGSVVIPEALRGYIGTDRITPKSF
ncbi:Serine--tRNA ligase [Candidatus Sulfotelmatobacter kueseliae]|uniref:Serine--tRNA ligase n=1 Tax=Candidatus Sulfotelmatobacter kueseliae TaxID=2042962 RepID=A0A2U3L012_9BACT|nr:Serine--tRNA ligase [Candidatus Sulfotelmatobacter kueseliae]